MTKTMYDNAIGKYVICRSSNEGVNFGKVIAADSTGVQLTDSRRLWYHKPSKSAVSWYEGVAKYGLHKDSKVSCLSDKLIVERYSLTFCTKVAQESVLNAKDHEQA